MTDEEAIARLKLARQLRQKPSVPDHRGDSQEDSTA